MATLAQLVTGIVVCSNKLSENLGELEPQTAACILQDAENLYDLLMEVTEYSDDDEVESLQSSVDRGLRALDRLAAEGGIGADEEESE